MKSQVGARYLHRRKTRKDKSFNGIIRLTNRRSVKLTSGARRALRGANV